MGSFWSTVADAVVALRDAVVALRDASLGGATSNQSSNAFGGAASRSGFVLSPFTSSKSRLCANRGTRGMSRNSTWSCCKRDVAVDAARYCFNRFDFAAFVCSTRVCAAARAESAASSRRRSVSAASSTPRSAESASIVRLDDDALVVPVAFAVSSAAPGRHRGVPETRRVRFEDQDEDEARSTGTAPRRGAKARVKGLPPRWCATTGANANAANMDAAGIASSPRSKQ